jgi:predicted Fe-S protein YdhL (DUF1289 family)
MTQRSVVDLAVDIQRNMLSRQEAIQSLTARANSVSLAGENIPTPCISVCRVNADDGLCEGCFRTLGEISAWSRSTAANKRELWKIIMHRVKLALD